MLSKAWTYSAEDALAFYGTKADTGLTDAQVKRNRELHGENCTFPSLCLSTWDQQ